MARTVEARLYAPRRNAVKVAALLFDVTDTLIELAEDVGAPYARVAARHGVHVPADALSASFLRIVKSADDRVFPGLPAKAIPDAEREWWRARVRETFALAAPEAPFANFEAFFGELFAHYSGAEAWRLCPGARPALENARRAGLRLGVVSNFDYRLPDLLQALEIDEFLETTTHPASCGLAKPSAAIFQAAARALDLAPGQCAYVGHDPRLDLAGARAAGLSLIDMETAADEQRFSACLEGLAKLPS